MKTFLSGLVTALIVGFVANVLLGYIKFGYFQNPEKILGGLTKIFNGAAPQGNGAPIDKDVKNCKDLISEATSFGTLKVIVTGNGKPIENLEVDVSRKPGPQRCMEKTRAEGVVLFSDVPAGKMVIYFNNADFPKEFGASPVISVDIVSGQILEKTIELKRQ